MSKFYDKASLSDLEYLAQTARRGAAATTHGTDKEAFERKARQIDRAIAKRKEKS